MLKKYILAVPKELRGRFLEYSRLYAYPTIPELYIKSGEFIILDSGAFGLSKIGKEITKDYMIKLNEHYLKFNASDNFPIICVAPDKYLDPVKTMDNFKFWVKQNYCKTSPVLQCLSENKIDLNFLKYQVDFYSEFTKNVILFSNNGLTALEMKGLGLEILFSYIKNKGFKWIHILGGGWFPEDLINYNSLKFFDSIDTIQYYKIAKNQKESWNKKIKDNWIEKAVNNGIYGNYLINILYNKMNGIEYV